MVFSYCRCPQSVAKVAAFVSRVLATRMPGAVIVVRSLKALLDEGSSSALLEWRGWSRYANLRVMGPDVRPLSCRLRVVVDDVRIGGGAIRLGFLAFLVL